MADESFTRSLYIGRDKAMEVARRREAAEAELRAKWEERIRTQNERLQRAAQMKEQELKEKSRQKQVKELQRQRAVLDRRCAQQEQQKAKVQELLQRAKVEGERATNSHAKVKPSYVFGSSTPRELSYLERLSHEQKTYNTGLSSMMTESKHSTSSRSSKDRAVSVEGGPSMKSGTSSVSRVPSRMAASASSKRPATQPRPNVAMTRSVFGTLGTAPSRGVKPPPLPRTTPVAAPRSAGGVRAPLKGVNSAMTRSMYAPTNKRAAPPSAKRAQTKPSTPNSARLTVPTTAFASKTLSNHQPQSLPPEPVRKPVIRPRKAIAEQPKVEVEEGIKVPAEEQTPEIKSPDPTSPSQPPLATPVVTSSWEDQAEEQPPTASTSETLNERETEETAKPPMQEEELLIDTSDGDAREQGKAVGEVVEIEEERGGINTESKVTPETTPQTTPPTSPGGMAKETKASYNEAAHRSEIITSSSDEQPQQPSPVSSSISPIAGLQQSQAEVDREREERRERLNQILQRTRMDNAGGGGVGGAAALSNGIDATALAQDLLAQRRQQKLQLQQQQQQHYTVNGGVKHEGDYEKLKNGGGIVLNLANENPLFEQNGNAFHRQHHNDEHMGQKGVEIESLLSQLTEADAKYGDSSEVGDEMKPRGEHQAPEDPRINGTKATF